MSEIPSNLKAYARSYKPLILKADAEDMETFLTLPVDVWVLEPTGSYGYIWVQNLQRAGKEVRLVSSRRVRHFCEYRGLINKADRPDAAAIAAYTLDNYHDEQAFLKIERMHIRDLYLQISSTARSKNPVVNRLGQRLGFEFPEIVDSYEQANRQWLDPKPPGVYLFLAGEAKDNAYSRKRALSLQNTIGCGLTPHTQALARQLCAFERIEYDLELALASELSSADFEPYHRVFQRFEIPNRIQAAILSRIYPFEDFLRDGKPFKEYVRGTDSHRKSGMTKRDRSEGEFKLSLGMGKILHQSGGKTEWKAGGAQYARTALWQYVKVMIVIRRSKFCNFSEVAGQLEKQFRKDGVSPWLNLELVDAVARATESSREIATLRLHYEFQNTKGDRRISATAGRFCRMLYRELLKEVAVR